MHPAQDVERAGMLDADALRDARRSELWVILMDPATTADDVYAAITELRMLRRTSDMTANQMTALRVLAGPRVISEIGHMSRSSAQAAVARLIRDGLAVQAGSAIGGGSTYTITDAGRAVLAASYGGRANEG